MHDTIRSQVLAFSSACGLWSPSFTSGWSTHWAQHLLCTTISVQFCLLLSCLRLAVISEVV